MNNKKAKKGKEKKNDREEDNEKKKDTAKIPILRNKAERQVEAYKIISKLTELELNITYEPVKELFKILQNYINNGGKIKVNIPFPMINKRICGILPDTVNEQCCIALIREDFS